MKINGVQHYLLMSATAVMASVALLRMWARRRREPQEATKPVTGAAILASAPLVLVLGAAVQTHTGGRLSLAWALAFHALSSIGYAHVIPIGPALFSKVSPRAVAGLKISAFYTHLFLTNLMVGGLGALLETMSAAHFWLIHSGLIGAAALALLVMVCIFHNRLAPHTYAPAEDRS